MTNGPVAFMKAAFALLPDDPADTTADGLAHIAAISEGLARHRMRVADEMAALARSALDMDESDQAVADERARLDAEHERLAQAERHFDRYARLRLTASTPTPSWAATTQRSSNENDDQRHTSGAA